jgi:aminoglycoside phosphotransferase (APT) family kinase protein
VNSGEADALSRSLSRHLGGTVHDLRRLSGGASRTTWSFDHSADSGPASLTRPLIVQVARVARSTTGFSMADEAVLLTAAARAGVPVPAVVAGGGADDEADPDGFRAPFMVTERLEGETIPRKLLRDPQYETARQVVITQAATALAAIHAIPMAEAGALAGGDQVEQFGDLLGAFDPPRPALELALRRLRKERPTSDTTSTVVHGDFRTGNLLLDTGGLRAVLDWELAHSGDPLEDLGWFCVRAWRFGGSGRAGGFGSDTEFIDAYEQARGRTVDRDAVRWWEAVGTFKWAVMCMIQAASHRMGGRSSLEHATIGRRVCESEWDLLRLLGARLPDEPPVEAAPRSVDVTVDEVFGRPTVGELVEALRRFIVDDVVGEVEGRLQFNARVATTALGIVGRQLSMQAPVLERHRARLAALGYADGTALLAAIRAGECDERFDEVAGALLGSVADQLAVSNPKHLEPDAR